MQKIYEQVFFCCGPGCDGAFLSKKYLALHEKVSITPSRPVTHPYNVFAARVFGR